MKVEEAKKIVISLAKGVNPITGEVFSNDSPYNDPIIIQSLLTVANNVRFPKKQGKPKNAGLFWTEELKQEAAQLFKQGKSISELSKYFERTEGSICSELRHQGLIKNRI